MYISKDHTKINFFQKYIHINQGLYYTSDLISFSVNLLSSYRCYMAEILPTRRNQSINQSNNQSINQSVIEIGIKFPS